MIICTSDVIPDRKTVKTLGIARGNAVRARHIGKDILAGLKNIVGGEVHEYTKLMAETREHALDRMIADAEKLGADAVVGVQFTTSMISQGAAELLAYGTAVKLE
jgi:uncharacterized protein YbjQ (UPF0145 family)